MERYRQYSEYFTAYEASIKARQVLVESDRIPVTAVGIRKLTYHYARALRPYAYR